MTDRTHGGVNAGARLDRLPPGPFHRRVMMLIGMGMFLDAFDIYLAPGVLGALVKSGWSDVPTNAKFLSATFTGMLIGTLISGFVGDRFGRRFSYQANLLLFGTASLAAAFVPDMQWLIVCRFLMGVGLGAEIVVGYSSMNEFMPRKVRGRYVALLSMITNSAVVVSGFAGLWIIPTFGWRTMFGIVGVAAGIVWFLRKNMPESPRWLEKQGRFAEAEAILAAAEAEASRIAPLPPLEPQPAPASERFSDLFGPKLRWSLVLGAIITSCGSISLYGFLSWVPTFLVKSGVSLNSSLWATAIMGLGAPTGALLGSMLADRFGRRRSIIALTAAEALLGALYPFVGDSTQVIIVGFGVSLTAYALVAIGFALYVPELFPTTIRLRGVALVNAVGRGAGASIQFVIASMFAFAGIYGVAALLVGALSLQIIAVLCVGPETNDRSLEDIAAGERPITPAYQPGA